MFNTEIYVWQLAESASFSDRVRDRSDSSSVTTAGDGACCRFVLGAKRDIAGGGAGSVAAGLASFGS